MAKGAYTGAVLYQLTPPSGSSFAIASGTSETASGGQVVGFDLPPASGTNDAVYWTESGTPIDLSSSAYEYSHALGTDGVQQVGTAYPAGSTSFNNQATLWSGTPESAVDLNPDGFMNSTALGVNGDHQVGYAQTATTQDAMLWTGNAGSAVDLNPTNLTGFSDTTALASSGNQQVGNGEFGPVATQTSHALLWSGTADSAVDLNPTLLTGFTDNFATGTSGSQQVGYGQYNSPGGGANNHALLWSGTADSALDLNPDGISESEAFGVFGGLQVGEGDGSAMLWFGSPDSAVDLQLLLPADGAWTGSVAYSIDGSGNIYGTANGTLDDVTGTYAVEWSPVPEPASLSLLVVAAPALLARRRRTTGRVNVALRPSWMP
jgi:hypothetical protein